jgi:hypothetical protein
LPAKEKPRRERKRRDERKDRPAPASDDILDMRN